MSKEALAKVVQRAISDGAFRRQLSTDPASALRGFDLSADEAAAIRSGDSGRLSALGVDMRMSKAFTLGTDASGASSVNQAVSNDLGASYTGATTTLDPGSAGSSALIAGDTNDDNAALISGGGANANAAIIPGGPAHAFGANTGGDGPSFDSGLTSGDGTSEAVIVVDDGGVSGATTPGEASDGPNIQD